MLQLWTNLAIIISAVISAASVILIYRTLVADHERRRKQGTIEAYREIHIHINKYNEFLYDKFRYRVINVDELFDEHDHPKDLEIMRNIIIVLKHLEHMAVGINTSIYDIEIFNRLAGAAYVQVYDQLEPTIKKLRRVSNNPHANAEFEILVAKLKKMRGLVPLETTSGNIKYS